MSDDFYSDYQLTRSASHDRIPTQPRTPPAWMPNRIQFSAIEVLAFTIFTIIMVCVTAVAAGCAVAVGRDGSVAGAVVLGVVAVAAGAVAVVCIASAAGRRSRR